MMGSINVPTKFLTSIVHLFRHRTHARRIQRVMRRPRFDDLTQFPDAHNFISHPDVSLSEDHLGLAGLVTLRKAPRAKG